jgi:hypothetical protein
MECRTADDFRAEMQARRNSVPADDVRKARISSNAEQAYCRMQRGTTYEDWRMIGDQLMLITQEVLRKLGLVEWDKDDKKLVKAVNFLFEAWERDVLTKNGLSNHRPIGKDERNKLRVLMTDPKYQDWYMTLTGDERRRLNHPTAVISKFKREHPDPNARPKQSRARQMPSTPYVEDWARGSKPSNEAFEAKQAQEAEAEAAQLDAGEQLKDDVEQLKARIAELEQDLAAAKGNLPKPVFLGDARSAAGPSRMMNCTIWLLE